MNRALRANLPDADCKETIEKRVLRRGGLEAGRRTKIAVRVVAHAGERHMNEAAVVGLERDSQVERKGAVGAGCDLVAAAGEHLAAEALAFERSASDREDGERALRSRADFLDRCRGETQDHQRTSGDGETHVRAPRESYRWDLPAGG